MAPGLPCHCQSVLVAWLALLALNVAAAAGAVQAAGRSLAHSPSYQDTLRDAKEVSRLSDEIASVKLQIEEWQRKHAEARAYHEGQKKLIKRQIEIRKQQAGHREEELEDYEEEQEEKFTYLMCSYLLDAFFFEKSQDARVHVNHICMGRKSMHLLAGKPRRLLRRGKPRARSAGAWDDVTLRELGRGLRRISSEVRALVAAERRLRRRCAASGGCEGPAEMQRTLDAMKSELAAIKAEYFADLKRWRAERSELSAEENALGDDDMSTWHEKQNMKHRAHEKVKDKFCPVINQYYGIDEEKIISHALKECSPE